MIAHEAASGADPRRRMSVDELSAATLRAQPEVARPAKASDGVAMVVGVLGALGLGVLTLVGLSNGRAAPPPAVAARAAPIESIVVPVSTTAPRRIASAGSVATQTPAAVDPGQSRAMPMIIDNTALAVGTTAATDAATAPHGIAGASPMQPNGLSQDEMFAMRIGSDAPPVAYASGLGNPDRTVVQGTIIPAVLETALNSDLPGFVRAIVSRDVRSFDGSWVAVPRGSRLVGQYKSGLATGPRLHHLDAADPARWHLRATCIAGNGRRQ